MALDVVASSVTAAPRDERALLRHLDSIDAEAKAARTDSRWDVRCADNLRWRYGPQWPPQSGETPIFEANLLGNLVERKLAQLSQARPEMKVLGRAPQYQKSAEVLTPTIRAILDEQQFPRLMERAGDLCATFGCAIFNTAWDPYADFGHGDICIRVIDPRRLFLDPHVESSDQIATASYIRIDRAMPLEEVRAIWPGRGGLVQPDRTMSSFRDTRAPSATWWGDAMKRALKPMMPFNSPYSWAMISEYWVRSDQIGQDGKPLYPAGRVIHRPAGQGIILDDEPQPYWDGGWPIDIWDWRPRLGTPLGQSDVEDLRKAQESFLRLQNAMVRNVLLSSSMSVIGDHDALTPEEWAKLDNRAVRVIKKTRGREFSVQAPPELPQSHFTMQETLIRTMETLIGVSPAMQGKREAGIVATAAIEGLQTAAETLVRAAARRQEYVIESLGQKLISRICQYYTSDRLLAFMEPSGEWVDYTFKRGELIAPDTTDAERRVWFQNYRFKVVPLSSLPMNRIQRALMARELFTLGLVDDLEVLRQAEYPNAEEVLARTRQKQKSGQLPAPAEPGSTKKPRTNRRGTQLGFGN